MRPAHLLRSVKSDKFPATVICLDCAARWTTQAGHLHSQTAELLSWEGVGFSGVAGEYGAEHWASGSTADEFWQALKRQTEAKGAVTVFAQRSQLAACLLGMWERIESGNIALSGADDRDAESSPKRGTSRSNVRCVLEAPLTIIEFRFPGTAGKVKWLDVANYGLQPYQDGVPTATRVRRIAEFVRGMVAVLKMNGMGGLKDTVGSQSYYSFKRSGKTHLMECHNNERALTLESESLYGGRCEAFRLGRIRNVVYHLDVKSMYSYCASVNDVPVALAGVANELGAGDQPQLGEGRGLIADVTVETDEPAYPYRDVRNGITIWPVGVFRTVLSGPELMDALTRDRIVRWYRASWYEMMPALSFHMRRVMSLKDRYSHNADISTWIKMLGNCLIGKFASKDRRWVDCQSDNIYGKWDTWYEHTGENQWTRFRSISGHTQKEETLSWTYDAQPAVASWVCSLARMRLLKMIRCAGWEETYYCDTDALMVSHAGYSRLITNGLVRDGEAGYLQVKSVSDCVVIHGIKSYDEEGRSVRAGRPLSVASAGPGGVRYWIDRQAFGSSRERRKPEAVRIAIPFSDPTVYQHGIRCADGSVTPNQLHEE